MNNYLMKVQMIEELMFNQRVVNEETLSGIRQEVSRFIEMSGKDDLESIMVFIINYVGQDSYNQGVMDSLTILRKTFQEPPKSIPTGFYVDVDEARKEINSQDLNTRES